MTNKKPKILFVGTLPPPVHGSAVVSQQIKESKVINEAFDGDWVNLSTSRRMDEIGKKTLAKPFRLLGALCKELWYLLTRHYDLCYLAITCHGVGFLKDSPFILLCKLFRKKIIIHQHNKGMANDVDRWPYRWLLPLCYKNAKVILLSWYLYPDIERVVKKEDVFICPNGIKINDNHNDNENKCYTDSADNTERVNRVPRLLFLSNLIESKGVLVLLDALEILKDKGYSFICDFVGGETKEIDAKRFKEEVEQRGLNQIAIYLGRMYGEEKEAILDMSDIFALPTTNDCFPLVLLEAMERHLPIVTTQIGGIPDIVQDGVNGKISEPQNAASLSECIENLLTDTKLRETMGEEGYRILKEKFTEEVFVKRMQELLAKAMGGGRLDLQSCFVQYLGKRYGEKKERIFNEADIFVFPTYYDNECFPLVLLEAMLHGLPCVTTGEGGIRDIVVNGTGFTVHSSNPSELSGETAIAIEKLMIDAEIRNQMSNRARKRVMKEFTEEMFERRMKGILEGCFTK